MVKKSLIQFNIPNILGLSRIILTFVVIALLQNYLYLWGLIVFLLASMTDLLDGYLARRLGQVTEFGAWLDSVADNIFTIALIFYFYVQREVPSYYLIILVIRNGLQFSHSILKFGSAPKWPKTRNKLNRWEPGMVFFVLLFLFIKINFINESAPIYRGIDQIILPYVFMPLSALTNLIVSIRFLVTRAEVKR